VGFDEEDPVEEEELNVFAIVLRRVVSGEALLVSYLKKIISIFFKSAVIGYIIQLIHSFIHSKYQNR
jgi:hypothetical protein